MDKKPFVIGITGNIASGKSVVRNFLANMGAFCIDADITAQESYLPGMPAWQAILDEFGDDLKMQDGQINRSKLGRLVFSDPQSMLRLEEIVHPYVTESILAQIQSCTRPILVVEAIKLIESDLASHCDQIWTVAADESLRLNRLIEHRAHSEDVALRKIRAQSSQEEKISHSDQVIWTNTSFEETYHQTLQAIHAVGQPTSHGFWSEEHSISTLQEKDFPWILEVLEKQTAQDWDPERIYQLLGGKLVPTIRNAEGPIQTQRLSSRQTMTLLTNQFPINSEFVNSSGSLQLLAQWLTGAYKLLLIPAISMTSKEAWHEGLLPGEDGADYYPRPSYEAFLKEHGLMPGEVWLKHLE